LGGQTIELVGFDHGNIAAYGLINGLNELLASHEYTVGQFYFKNKRFVGALWRFEYIRDNYPNFSKIDAVIAKISELETLIEERDAEWKKRLEELKKDTEFQDAELPSRSRIAAFLKQEGYTRPYERHSDLPQPEKKVAQRVHEEWEMDARGEVDVEAVGRVSIINIVDVRSHLKVESLPCVDTSHPNTQHYQLILRRAFLQYGLPERISLDHDSVFYDNASASPYPTTLHLWLIALGVEVRFIENPPPIEHGLIERTHQTIYQQAVAGQTFTGEDALQQKLTQRRSFLNHDFPSRTLNHRSPLQAYPQAQHSSKPYHPQWEEAMLDIQRIYDFLAQGRWFRRSSLQGQFSLGAHRYNAGRDFAEQQLEITFDPHKRNLVCRSQDGKEEIRFPIQGLSKSDLMQELTPLVTLPLYQLALPFTPQAWREIILCDHLIGTTL